MHFPITGELSAFFAGISCCEGGLTSSTELRLKASEVRTAATTTPGIRAYAQPYRTPSNVQELRAVAVHMRTQPDISARHNVKFTLRARGQSIQYHVSGFVFSFAWLVCALDGTYIAETTTH